MTYKGSNWTRGELGHAPDPNPLIPCARCETEYGFQDYWEERYVEPDNVDPHEAEWLCDECKRQKRRQENNHGITEWVA